MYYKTTQSTNKRPFQVCKTILSCTTLGSSAAMLSVVISVKILTKGVAVARLDIEHGTKTDQGTWKYGL